MSGWSGWRRLWLVLSILFGAPILLISINSSDVYEFIRLPADPASARTAVDASGWKAKRLCRSMPEVVARPITYPSNGYEIDWSCVSTRQFQLSFLYALLPAALMAAIGFIIRWIYRGFRKNHT